MEKYKAQYTEQGILLGKGVSGQVELVKHKSTDQHFAAKKIWIKSMRTEDLNPCLNEVKILMHLKHKNIVNCQDFFRDQNTLIIILELCPYGDLMKLCKKLKHSEKVCFIPLVRKMIIHSVLQALSLCHKSKIIHRDVKPENIIISDDYSIKLADFGVSRILAFSLQKASTYVGTPHYLSPELIAGQEYSTKSDIWSLGICYYFFLYGSLPFEGKAYELQQKIEKEEPVYDPLLAQQNQIIRKMLNKNQEKRLSADDLLSDPFFAKLSQKPAQVFFSKKVQEAEQLPQQEMTQSGMSDSGLVDSGLVDSGLVDSGLVDSGLMSSGMVSSQNLAKLLEQLKMKEESKKKEMQ